MNAQDRTENWIRCLVTAGMTDPIDAGEVVLIHTARTRWEREPNHADVLAAAQWLRGLDIRDYRLEGHVQRTAAAGGSILAFTRAWAEIEALWQASRSRDAGGQSPANQIEIERARRIAARREAMTEDERREARIRDLHALRMNAPAIYAGLYGHADPETNPEPLPDRKRR